MTDSKSPLSDLIREESSGGMEPKSIVIGDRLKHTVHHGAMKLPETAFRRLHNATQHHGSQHVDLPSVDSVARPTQMSTGVTVTYLNVEKYWIPPTVPDQAPVEGLRTVATNQIWNAQPLDPDRLRGGGGEEEALPAAPTVASVDASTTTASGSSDTTAPTIAQKAPDPSPMDVDKPPVSQLPEPAPYTGGGDKSVGLPAPDHDNTANPSIHQAPPAGTPAVQPPSTTTTTTTTPTPPTAHDPPAVPPPSDAEATTTMQAPETAQSSTATQAPTVVQPTAATTGQVAGTQPPISTVGPTVVSTPNPHVPAQAVASTSQATVVPSSIASSSSKPRAATPVVSAAPAGPKVVPLTATPAPQYKQHIPHANDEMQVEIKNSRPSWYTKDNVSEFERTMLPEWFNFSAKHRTKESFVQAREKILSMSTQLGNRFISSALIRRTILGDVGSLSRLGTFLTTHGMINADAINDSTPTAAAFRPTTKKRPAAFEEKLAQVVMKKAKDSSIDWEQVADEVGATTEDCRRGFLSINFDVLQTSGAATAERSITPDNTDNKATSSAGSLASIASALGSVDDKILEPTIEAALKHTSDLSKARSAAVTAALAAQATLKAGAEEHALSHVLQELNDRRMQRLEQRLEMLNDVEGMLEAERMALELERRDLYTARCRQWFGGGSS